MTTLVTITNSSTNTPHDLHNVVVTNPGGYGRTLLPGETATFHVWQNGDLTIKEVSPRIDSMHQSIHNED